MRYLIWSIEHRAWWKPGKWGYTTATHAAGRFTFEEAKGICDEANSHGREEEIAVYAPSRQQTTADLIESGLKVPWITMPEAVVEEAHEVQAQAAARLPRIPFGTGPAAADGDASGPDGVHAEAPPARPLKSRRRRGHAAQNHHGGKDPAG